MLNNPKTFYGTVTLFKNLTFCFFFRTFFKSPFFFSTFATNWSFKKPNGPPFTILKLRFLSLRYSSDLGRSRLVLLFSDPHFQWGGKSSSVLRFFSKFCQNSPLYNSTPLTQSPCSAFIFHTEMGIISKVKMGLRSERIKI